MEYITPENIESFFLVFVRTLTIIIFLPVIGYQGINMKVKVLFALLFSVLIFPSATPISFLEQGGFLQFAACALNEILTGIIIGFVPQFLFAGFQFGGEFMGMQMGLTMIQMMDPTTEANISVMARLLYIFIMVIFLFIGGHLFFIEAIGLSLEVIPLGHFAYTGVTGILKIVTEQTATIFVIGIKAGAPVIVSLFVIEVGMGFIARTVPQMNIFLVGVPLKIGIGLIIFLIILGYTTKLFINHFGQLQSDMLLLLKIIGG